MAREGFRGLMRRLIANLVLSYVIAAIVTFVFLTIGSLIGPPTFGPAIIGGWIFEMALLMVGAPSVLIVLVVLDYVLSATTRQRRLALGVSLLPAALVALLIVPYPQIAYVVAWLVAVGGPFGMTMLLPMPRRAVGM